jgi:glycosyltransferase involved in cell wall biosynthesis
MHICFITSEFPKTGYPHGGVGTFVGTLGKALVEKGVKVSVVGLNYIDKNETETIEGIKIYRLSSKKIYGLQWYFNSRIIAATLKKINLIQPIDFVETSELGLAFLPKMKGVKYIIRLHGGHHFFAKAEKRSLELWKVFQEKKSFKKADHIIAVSSYVAESTRNLLNLKNTEIEIIYNPINSKKFYQCDIKKIKKHSIFFAGSIIEKKGIRQLIQSLDYLVDEFSDVHLYIAGRDAKLPGTNIQYRPILENFINEKIRSHITFLGVVSNTEIMNYIESSELCCYPSHMEAMPLAWLEVLAMGKSFIGSKTGPGPEVVKENITGLLVNPFEPKEIADKIRFLFNNPKLGVEMGTLARDRIIKEFDIEVIVNQNISFFNRHLKKK